MKKNVFQFKAKQTVFIALTYLVFTHTNSFAQLTKATERSTKIGTSLQKASDAVGEQYTYVVDIMYAICAIIAIIGAIQVFTKFTNGAPDAKQATMSWVGALIFAVLVTVVVNAMFIG